METRTELITIVSDWNWRGLMQEVAHWGYLELNSLGRDGFEMDRTQERHYIFKDDQQEMVG
jgi:hypothetical protein